MLRVCVYELFIYFLTFEKNPTIGMSYGGHPKGTLIDDAFVCIILIDGPNYLVYLTITKCK